MSGMRLFLPPSRHLIHCWCLSCRGPTRMITPGRQILFRRRGVAVSAGAVGAALASFAVTTAPPGLAVTVSTGSIAATTGECGSTMTFLKAMWLTKVKLGLVAAVLSAAVGTSIMVQRPTFSWFTPGWFRPQHAGRNTAAGLDPNLFFQTPGGAATRDAIEFLNRLWSEGRLPGVTAGEHGYMFLDSMATNAEPYPLTRTVHLAQNDERKPRYHYKVVRTSELADWSLRNAWVTDARGRIRKNLPISGEKADPQKLEP
jgi:hypothetical protein